MKTIYTPSLLDNDLYKFTMQQGVVELFDERVAKYKFINRGKEKFTPTMLKTLQARINAMAKLQLTQDEKEFMRGTGLFGEKYLNYLGNYRYNPAQVKMTLDKEGNLGMEVEGKWAETILWEVPLMAAISETYLDEVDPLGEASMMAFHARTLGKARAVKEAGLELMEFGTRRRRNYAAQNDAVEILKANAGETFIGTSNVHLAMKHGLQPMGTMAHEWIMAHAAIFGVEKANPKALQSWRKIYPNKLKTFLPDTYTTELAMATLSDEDIKYLNGFRWDSGCPLKFTDMITARCQKANDTTTKRIPYTDGLRVTEAIDLAKKVAGRVNPSAGIGTSLTNDFDIPALRIVIKLDELDGIAVAKISDTPAKASGHKKAIAEALQVIERVTKNTLNVA